MTMTIKKAIAYGYLFYAFGYLILIFSQTCSPNCSRPIGYFLVLLVTLALYSVYVIINHLFLRLVISHKTLGMIETNLLLVLIIIFCKSLNLW